MSRDKYPEGPMNLMSRDKYPIGPINLTTLQRFIAQKRREILEFCTTCRVGGFDERKCADCDLYLLALGKSLSDHVEGQCNAAYSDGGRIIIPDKEWRI